MGASFEYNLSRRGTLPRYEFLYRCIRHDILRGTLHAGEQLPSKRNFAHALRVSIATIEHAYQRLMSEGYIEGQARCGYFVCNIQPLLLHSEMLTSQTTAKPNNATENKSSDQRSTAEHRLESSQASGSQLAVEPDTKFDADLQANRPHDSLFPTATWLRLVRRVISENPPNLFSTIPYNGIAELRNALAQYLYRARGMRVSPSCIIVGAGTEYLYGRLIQLFGNNVSWAFENPGYRKLAHIANNHHVPWTFCNVDKSGLLVHALRSTNANVVHVSPANNFPGGFAMSAERREELLEWAYEDRNRFIVEDDYDSELRFGGALSLPLCACDSQGKTIYLNTFSKTLMPSLRISYMILPESLLERYRETMSFYSCTVSSLEQHTLAKFINEGYFERHLLRMRTHYKRQRQAILKALNASDITQKGHVFSNNTGTHFLLYLDTALSPEAFKREAAQRGLNVALLAEYCFEDYSLANKIAVINYANLSESQIEKTIRVLSTIVHKTE